MMSYNELRKKYPNAEVAQLESLEAYIYFAWRIVGEGVNNSIEIERKHQRAYIRADGAFRLIGPEK